jgi:hypothetical protein
MLQILIFSMIVRLPHFAADLLHLTRKECEPMWSS